MNPQIINASDYILRSDLESYIRNEIGDNIDTNRLAGHTIQGTAADLKALGLSSSTRVYGIKCVILADH